MKRTTSWITMLLVMTSGTVLAQAPEPEEPHTALNVAWALPQGAFADRVDDPGVGLTFLFGGRVPGLPLVLGTEVGFLSYGSDARLDVHDIFSVPVGVTTIASNHGVAMGHLVARLQPPTGVLQPYVDALVGLRYFITHTRFTGDVAFDDDDLYAASNFSDLGLSYGGGGGLELLVYTGPMGWDKRTASVSLNVGVRYLFGSEAEYLREGSLRQVGGQLFFDVEESRTNMLVPQFGLHVRL